MNATDRCSGFAIAIALLALWNHLAAGAERQPVPSADELTRMLQEKANAAREHAEKPGNDSANVMGARAAQRIRVQARPGAARRIVPDRDRDPRKDVPDQAPPSPVLQFLYVMGGAVAVYAVVILLMAAAGLILAAFSHAPSEGPSIEELQGDPARGESWLAKPYLLAMGVSLMLFYVAVPLVTVGLLAATAGVLYLIFQLPRVPVKLIIIVLLAGLGMAWAVLKSLFARPGGGEFGVAKTAADCPRLHAAVQEVAARTETDPVDEIYISPGSAIGVRQEGRGPFGMFGVKRRVLTLGLSTMYYLTVTELKAILAHEYAHFSNRDTFYIRFIHRVPMSIEAALEGMGQAVGKLNYVNPFFWFFWLYYKAYMLLSAGFSRSREFLADRLSASLYGRKAFVFGLTKVATDGTLFEMSIYQNISSLLDEGKAFVNMYQAFREYREGGIPREERDQLYQSLLQEKRSLFASHPSFQERVEAVAGFPDVPSQDNTPAMQLFENPEAIEQEMTDFLTGFMQLVRHAQAAQAAQA
jgi:Zn-dependent protease with chaperone function